ncbi:MAG: hypothetical protein J0H81_01690 [Sphingopyxis terrae]|nr:hypothetical protein [Sphingopyxis terrae]
MRRMRAMLAGIWAAFWLVAALPAAAQIAPDLSPATAEKVAENDRKELAADLSDRAAISERTLKLIAADRGENSAPYLAKLLVHANNLSWAHRAPESRQALVRAVEIATRLYGAGTYATADVERQYALALRINGYREEAIEAERRTLSSYGDEAERIANSRRKVARIWTDAQRRRARRRSRHRIRCRHRALRTALGGV